MEEPYLVIRDGLIVRIHEHGEWQVGELPDMNVDLVAHVLPGQRQDQYIALLRASPLLLHSCKELYTRMVNSRRYTFGANFLREAKRAISIAESALHQNDVPSTAPVNSGQEGIVITFQPT